MALLSKVKIANMALDKVGASANIESLDEDSAEARGVKLWYDFALEEALSAFNWSFARKRQLLAEHSEDPPEDRWAYRYIYPSDCVKARLIENPSGDEEDPVPYIVELASDDTKSILTDTEDAKLIYTSRITQTSLYSPLFVEFLSAIIGSKVAWSLTGKQYIRDKLEEEARLWLFTAPAADAQEKQESKPRDADHIRARA